MERPEKKILELKSVDKNFDGLKAICDLSFEVQRGEILSMIGPNGAGKTTLFHLITGVFPPSSGRILFQGQEITHLKSHQIAALGISRTYQNLSLFHSLTPLENVLLGCKNLAGVGFFKAGLRLPGWRKDESRSFQKAGEIFRMAGLDGKISRPIGTLSLKERKILEIMRALASEPSLLLLDEPAAGLRGREIDEIMDFILKIHRQGTTVIMVEHQMEVVMSISNRVIVLSYGVKISEGNVQEVSRDPAVIQAYLGGDLADAP